jgi:hypothetical protein
MVRVGALAAAVMLAWTGAAEAAELRIVDVKAFVFLEHAGKLSDDIIGGEAMTDAPRGGAPGAETATGLFLDFTFEGERNAAPKYATATVD